MTFGFTEEKLLATGFGILVLTSVAFASAHWTGIQTVFSSFVGGLVSLVGIFCGTNTLHNWINSKNSIDNSTDNNTPKAP